MQVVQNYCQCFRLIKQCKGQVNVSESLEDVNTKRCGTKVFTSKAPEVIDNLSVKIEEPKTMPGDNADIQEPKTTKT